ncbi:hypothetical protein [Candidatus Uabimicrobium amorphum]|uniref:Uncharacterized protein n=1 Tax=Uabimicrobium amorphum TaxID=2596890 RepID=A0A5S9F6Q9_UABAM|nr:hypothetical protein [Candidatus Uabimicrobium amorphum]BBM86884.1 hypothetical protein UABAM_05286 [Candidatus Uabimicrobium amorphum]
MSKEMKPPWEVFPTYERYTIGWRMGAGEQYRYDWYDFLKRIPKKLESRLAYLKRHRPAPINWGASVYQVLYPDSDYDDYNKEKTPELLDMGVIEYDAAYNTWLKMQNEIAWPWAKGFFDGPEETLRYNTREFWFFSRQFQNEKTPSNIHIPDAWQGIAEEIQTGKMSDVNPEKGLLTLAKMLCAGSIKPPWFYELSLDDFEDNFEMDMGYVDAFRLWIMCSFDDDLLLRDMLEKFGTPSSWKQWIEEQCDF